MNDLATIASLITTVSLFVGLVLALLELRQLIKTRKTDIIMRIYERFSSRELIEAMNKIGGSEFENFESYRNKYGMTEIAEIAVLFDSIGILVEQNFIDVSSVDSFFGSTIFFLWQRMKPVIYAMREGTNESHFFSHYEYLINRLELYWKKK
jgi:hypothetical protein